MPAALIPVLIQVGLQIIGWILKKFANDEELLRAFKTFSELARTENIKTIMKRQNAEKQLDAANKKWDQIEAEETAKNKGMK